MNGTGAVNENKTTHEKGLTRLMWISPFRLLTINPFCSLKTYSSLSILTGSNLVIPLLLKNAVTNAQTRIRAAVITNQITSVEKTICLIPKKEKTVRNSWFEKAMCRRMPRTIPIVMVGMLVMRVLLISSPEV